MGLIQRAKSAWNAFMSRAPTAENNYGPGYAYQPTRQRFYPGSEKTTIMSVQNRIAMDVAAVDFRHVKVDENGRFSEEINSELNYCLSQEANIRGNAAAPAKRTCRINKERGGSHMNDWLDYKGSGSSRAYMGDTISHGLYEDQINYKQHAADRRLLEAKKEQLSSLKIKARNAELSAQAMSKRILDSEKLKKKYEAELSKIQSEYKALRTDEPLKAHQKFAESEWAYKEYVKYMDDKIAKEKAKWSEYSNSHSELKSKILKVQQEVDNLEKSLSR